VTGLKSAAGNRIIKSGVFAGITSTFKKANACRSDEADRSLPSALICKELQETVKEIKTKGH